VGDWRSVETETPITHFRLPYSQRARIFGQLRFGQFRFGQSSFAQSSLSGDTSYLGVISRKPLVFLSDGNNI
jgi:hypothetical protein